MKVVRIIIFLILKQMKSQVHMGFMQFQGSPYIGAPSDNYGKDYQSPYPNLQDANAHFF